MPRGCVPAARIHQRTVDTESLCVGDPPRLHDLAANSIYVFCRALEDCHLESGSRETVRQSPTCDPPADYNH
jgi:hypothetical protein